MKARILVAAVVAAATVAAGSTAFAQESDRVVHNQVGPYVWEGPMGTCDDGNGGSFTVMNRWEAVGQQTTHLDKAGQVTEVRWHYAYPVDIVWNSETGKTLTGGPGEVQNMRLVFEDGVPAYMYESGAILKLTVPGYGLVYAETGHIKLTSSMEVLVNAGHSDVDWSSGLLSEAGLQAVCDALR